MDVEIAGGGGGGGGGEGVGGGGSRPPPSLEDYQRVLWLVKGEAFCVWAVFAVTISLFPTVAALIRPEHPKGCMDHSSSDSSSSISSSSESPFTDETFTAFLFVLFNLLDLVGRSAAGFVRLIPPVWLPVFAALRFSFVPLFLLW